MTAGDCAEPIDDQLGLGTRAMRDKTIALKIVLCHVLRTCLLGFETTGSTTTKVELFGRHCEDYEAKYDRLKIITIGDESDFGGKGNGICSKVNCVSTESCCGRHGARLCNLQSWKE